MVEQAKRHAGGIVAGTVVASFECSPVVVAGHIHGYISEVDLDDGRLFMPRTRRRLRVGIRVKMIIAGGQAFLVEPKP